MTKWKTIVFILCAIQNWKTVTCDTLLVPLRHTEEANCECGKLTRKVEDERLAKVKIAGGRIPWLAELITSIENYGNEDDEFRLCFGTVVSLQTVLFPASCIDSNFKSKPKVKLLGIDSKKDAIKEITSVYIHSSFRRKYDNDLAVVKLKNVIDFNQTKVVPICLPKPSRMYPIKYPEEKTTMSPILQIWSDNTGFADSGEDDPNRMKPCRNTQPPCEKRPCPPCPNKAVTPKPKPPDHVLANSVTRTWFHRKGPGYDYIRHFGRFDVQTVNASKCSSLFPEMLQSKLACVQQKEIRNIVKQNGKFFTQLELGMPLMLSNTTLVKGKPQPVTTKYYLQGIRAPGSSGGIPLLDSRENTIAVLKIEDYVPWIRENSHSGHFCKT